MLRLDSGLSEPSYHNFQASNSLSDRDRANHLACIDSLRSDNPPQETPSPETTAAKHHLYEAPSGLRALAALPLTRRARLPRHNPLPRRIASRHQHSASTMSVAYEPRSFIHEGGYPPIGDEHDHAADQRFTDSEVAEHLSHYTADASLLQDDRVVLGDDRVLMGDDSNSVQDGTRLDLSDAVFTSPMQVSLHEPSVSEPLPDSKEVSPSAGSPPSSRIKPIPKPERDVSKKSDGKFHCPLDDCLEDIRAFSRKCEWNKHMDKHERPYRCPAEGCENLPGFTYSGGLLRHEREVHGKHGGPKNTVNCPHPNCKRHTGKGFSRQENLNEHLRRVHTNMEGQSPIPEAAPSPEDNESEKSGTKRKRQSSGSGPDEATELRDEIKRVRMENARLKSEMEQQSQHALAMMAQIAELQDALRHGLGQHGLGAPTAQMI